VCAYVFLQVARRLEGLVAAFLWTFVRLLPSVYARVTLQTVASCKRLVTAAEVTLERTVARV